MTTLTVKIQGDKQLMRALDGDLRKATRRAAVGIAREVIREVAEYPPLSSANAPGKRWYQRGYGPRWTRKDGTVGGAKTSEMLNRSWGVKRLPMGVLIGSRASYAPVVHHHKEQVSFHRRRGWVTDKQAVERVRKSGKMERIMNRVIKRILKG